jgi:hypothetical protein
VGVGVRGMNNSKYGFRAFYLVVSFLVLIFNSNVYGTIADQEDAARVCENWLQTIVYYRGAWANSDNPNIEKFE